MESKELDETIVKLFSLGEGTSHTNKNISKINTGMNSPTSKDTQYETVDMRKQILELKSTLPEFENNEFDQTGEIQQSSKNTERVEVYDSVNSYSTNFSVFQNIHEQTFNHEIFGRSSLKKNLSLLQNKNMHIKTKTDLEAEEIKEEFEE